MNIPLRNKLIPVVHLGDDLVTGTHIHFDVKLDDLERSAVQRIRRRMRVAVILFSLVFTLLGIRLVHLTIGFAEHNTYITQSSVDSYHSRPFITDRNGVLMATKVNSFTIGADTRVIQDVDKVIHGLKQHIPHLDIQRTKHLLKTGRPYVELTKGLTPRQRQGILTLGNPALKLRSEDKRVYPQGILASHVLGFVSSDARGLAGLEFMIDRSNTFIFPENGIIKSTIDLRVQHSVRFELQNAVREFSAKGGGAIIVDVNNGDVLAMVSLPDFDPNQPNNVVEEFRFNRTTLGIYELGSIFKIFTAAMALDLKTVNLDDTFDTRIPMTIGKYEINDFHGQERPLTVSEIVTYSSNIGAAHLALSVSPEMHYDFFSRLGFLDRPHFELPELAHPIVPERWNDLSRVTSSYGHGMAISLLQAIAAGSAMVNGGILYPPRLIDHSVPKGIRVISENTSKEIVKMMRMVVTAGTASKANLPAYPILGKTGSAEKAVKGGYDSHRLITSFLGAFPADKPRYAFIVMLDEPNVATHSFGHMTAGWNVVPVTAKIITRIAPLLNIMPRKEKRAFHMVDLDMLVASERGGL